MNFSIFSWKKSEALFVLCVLLVLFSVSFWQLRIGEMKTRDAQRKADVELVARAIRNYWADHGEYPISSNGQIVLCGKNMTEECVWGRDAITDEENVVYIKNLPQDPFTDQGRRYVYVQNGSDDFDIYVALERSSDVDYKKDLTIACGINVQCNWYVSAN